MIMTTGSHATPILIDCNEAYANRPQRKHRKEAVYRLGDLFDCEKYGIGRPKPKGPLRQAHSRSSPPKVRRDGTCAKPTPFKEVSRNRITKLAGRKLARSLLFDEAACCSCTDDEGCAESCQNREMCYGCDKTNCRIGPRCTNRVANKVEARCKVLQAGDRGFGLFADEAIRRNQFVAQYTGEVITMSECRERYSSIYSGRQVHYIMYMEKGFACDATSVGGKARFLNHHCDANCVVQKWVISGVPCLLIYAKRHVEAGEELTLDYKFDTFPGAKNQPCLCGAENCCGILGR